MHYSSINILCTVLHTYISWKCSNLIVSQEILEYAMYIGSGDRSGGGGQYCHACSHFWPMLCSRRPRYSNRAVTYSNKTHVYFFLKLHNLFVITQKIAWNTSLEPLLPGGHDHDTVCWPTLSTINETAEHVLLVLCVCLYVQVHLCVCWGRGCMFAMFVCLSYWTTVWSNLQVKSWSLIHRVLYMQK